VGQRAGRRELELNLLSSGHGEFADPTTRTQIGRSIFFKAVGRF